jgi:hypothetical protein
MRVYIPVCKYISMDTCIHIYIYMYASIHASMVVTEVTNECCAAVRNVRCDAASRCSCSEYRGGGERWGGGAGGGGNERWSEDATFKLSESFAM